MSTNERPVAPGEEPTRRSRRATEGTTTSHDTGPLQRSGGRSTAPEAATHTDRATSRSSDTDHAPGKRPGSAVAWTALLVAVVLTIWQAVYAYVGASPGGVDDVYTSANRFVVLVLGLVAVVLGIVALAQKRRPVWPAVAGLAVGLNGFIVGVMAWVGGFGTA